MNVPSDTAPLITLSGDFNQISDECMLNFGLLSVVNMPVHRGHYLDRIYTPVPLYTNVKVVESIINAEHRAIITRAIRLLLLTTTNRLGLFIHGDAPRLNMLHC